jgi:diguanylate cyclase (GGDEF)-like protein
MAALSWHSLKLRLPLLIVVLFLGGLWALAGFANYQLRHDMRHQIERQQRSVAALAAQALEHTLQERQAILLRVARHFAPVLEHAPEQLNRPATDFRALRQPFGEVLSTPDSTQLGLVVLQQLFNGGTFVTNAQGLALTSFPPHILRTGNDYGGESFIQAALAGRSVVSAPFIETGTPVVVLAVPIWGSSGQPIGVLAGVLDLSRPNLLSHIEQQAYGEQGTFFIADVATQTVLAANQPQRVMERLPPLGSNPLVDALAQGQFAQLEYENQGQAWLAALQPITQAHWMVVVSLPLDEALAPIDSVNQTITLAAVLVSVLAALAIAWRLHHALRPLAATTRTLSAMVRNGGRLQRIALPKQTEVRDMVQVFNHLVSEVEARQQAEREAAAHIDRLTSTDALTGLPNRQAFVDILAQVQAQCVAGHGLGALLYLDVDDFQSVNDTLGHEAGDAFLTALAQRIRQLLPPGAVVARPSGDEFLVLISQLPPQWGDAALHTERLAAALLHALEQPLAFAHTTQHCSVSIGIVVFGGATHEPPMELLRKVDLALNQAKNTGPGSILFYEAQMQAQVTTRARLQHDLREALQQESFCLHYQPQINAAGQVVGVEALVRWISKEHGFISPAEFIPLAEKTGLILPLGRWILHTACTQLAQWARQPQRQGLSMAVNVSAGQFQQSNFVEQVREVLQETGAPAHQLKLELTESAMVEDMEAVVARMQALRQLGVRFSIDDFGTGFSSLAYLKRLPLDQLKIDQGFVRDCLEDHNDASIAQTVIALGHSLGLEVIAEGVETAAHQAALQSWGCRFFQGYGISKPLPAQALEAFLTTHAAVAASASATTAPLPPG